MTDKGKEIYSLLEQKQIPWANSSSAAISAGDLDVTLAVLSRMNETLGAY